MARRRKIELVSELSDSSRLWSAWGSTREYGPRLRLRADPLAAEGKRAEAWRKVFSDGPLGAVLWLNLTGWTYNPRLSGGAKHAPFVLWDFQERAAERLWRRVEEGGDILIDKSRDMGATWLCLGMLLWWWLFEDSTPLLVASRKEEYVDGAGNPDTLFWKLDYLLDHQPHWLRPNVERRHMHLGNLDNGSVLSGESTNSDLGRGGRRKAILLDEFAAVENGREILTATADAAPCRIFNSTPQGRANAFADVRFSGKTPVLTMHWKDHPVKGKGARLVAIDAGEANVNRELPISRCGLEERSDSRTNPTIRNGKSEIRNSQSEIDGPAPRGDSCFAPHGGFAEQGATGLAGQNPKFRWTSPWYEAECARRTSRKEIAQELDIDYLASGEMFFDLDVLQRLRASGQLRPPLSRGELRFKVNTVEEGASYRLEDVEWVPEGGRRRLCLWRPLIEAEAAEAWRGESDFSASGRPRVLASSPRPCGGRHYVAFADVAHGTGASNSAIMVADAAEREVVAAYVCPDTPPHELARVAVAMCLWFSPPGHAGAGRAGRPCLLGWEANGPGGIFGLEVHRLGYRSVLGNPDPAAPWQPSQGGVGWQSSRDRKMDLLGDLRRALARDELTLHDEAVVAELEQYIYYPAGGVGPGSLVQEAEGARLAHGDRVIAAAGLLLCLGQQSRGPGARGGAPPPGSFACRQAGNRRDDDGGRWRE
jgi:hypothetical protein